MEKAITFFEEHAGYSYNPVFETPEQGRHRCAEELATAERWALDAGVYFDWEPDPDGYLSAGDAPGPWFSCCARNMFGHVVASLGGIDDPTYPYRRVVEAELALEAMNRD